MTLADQWKLVDDSDWCNDRWDNDRYCEVRELTIDAGRDVIRVDGGANGGIGIADVEGEIRAEATNGGLSLSGLAGDVKGRTTNGGVRLLRLDT